MPPLPIISGADCIQALRKFGYEFARQNGSHVRLVCPGRMPVTVPMHKPIKRGTLRSILRTAEIEVEVFVTALRR
jgi:predicted RNA binding protein YcfA (HicA-like mRNA interferase family)